MRGGRPLLIALLAFPRDEEDVAGIVMIITKPLNSLDSRGPRIRNPNRVAMPPRTPVSPENHIRA
jgi:hypothetical protein